MAIIGIVAIDRNGAIGKGGGLPWNYPADMRFFKSQTTGNACAMGYKTWLSLKKPLKNRLNIVLSSRSEVEPQESVVLLRDRQSVLSLRDYLSCDLYIIGGAQIFRDFMEEIDCWVVTEIPLSIEGADTFMPEDFLSGFVEYNSQSLGDDLTARFYKRR